MIRTLCVVLLAATCLAAPAVSQQPTQRQVDSLAAQVRQLRAKLDSVVAAVGRQPAAPPHAAAPVADELARLRAAASAAAGGGGPDTTRTADTLAQAMGLTVDRVSVKFKTAEKVGPVGEGRSAESQAIVTLEKHDWAGAMLSR